MKEIKRVITLRIKEYVENGRELEDIVTSSMFQFDKGEDLRKFICDFFKYADRDFRNFEIIIEPNSHENVNDLFGVDIAND